MVLFRNCLAKILVLLPDHLAMVTWLSRSFDNNCCFILRSFVKLLFFQKLFDKICYFFTEIIRWNLRLFFSRSFEKIRDFISQLLHETRHWFLLLFDETCDIFPTANWQNFMFFSAANWRYSWFIYLERLIKFAIYF